MVVFMIIITEEDKTRHIEHIKFLDLTKPWRVEVKLYEKTRSKAQNRLYWKWLTVISDYTGHTKEELHAELAYRFLEPLVLTIEGKEVTMVRSTTGLKVKEFTEYLNDIEMFAHDLSLVLPYPEDLYYEAMGLTKGGV